ncbi:MAG: metallophosphoesterase [Lentisphaeria bacterium]|nr:metallophosphoesterase [Lentisphaeria bacterium]
MVKLITLGTSHGDPGLRRFNSALLLRTSGGDYLFEAGAPVNALMIRKGIPFAGLKAVFASHTHEDHIGGLPGLIKSLVKRPEAGQHTDLFLPEKSCTDGVLAFMAAVHRPWPEELLTFSEIAPGPIFDDGDLRVTAYPTDHVVEGERHYPSWAFLAEAEGVRIVFTGDLSRDLHDFPLAAFDEPAVCVMECQHYAPECAVPIFRKLPITRFIGVHISARWDGHTGEFYKAVGRPRFPFELAEDGMEFDLSAPPVPKGTRPFTAAVLADLHLPDEADTVKEHVLDQALEKIASSRPDAVLLTGDMTARGTLPAARRLKKKLCRLPGKVFFTPGNAEQRTPKDADQVAACLKTRDRGEGVLLLESSAGRFSAAARAALARMIAENTARDLLAVTHYPPMCLPEEDRWLLAAAGRAGIIGLLVCGHLHYDKRFIWSGIRCEMVRGLDPDKAIGGPPAVVFFSRRRDGSWIRRETVCREADPVNWEPDERAALADRLGLSGMSDPFGGLEFAAREKVPVFEWRFAFFEGEQAERFRALLGAWRRAGGKCFSIHFPELVWENGELVRPDALRAAVRAALDLRADRITVHVPRVSVGLFSDSAVAGKIADAASEILRPLACAGIAVGVENLHMKPGEKEGPDRGFGYTPDEVLTFADMLTARGVPAGIHFDLGHARNNGAFGSIYPISSWLARCGGRINGCHLHQVTCDGDGKMLNHQAVTEPFGRLISLASLFLAWKSGELPRVPLILEIRGGRGPESWTCLRRYLGKNGKTFVSDGGGVRD